MNAIEILKKEVYKAEQLGIATDIHLGKSMRQAAKDSGTWQVCINVKKAKEILAINSDLLEALKKAAIAKAEGNR